MRRTKVRGHLRRVYVEVPIEARDKQGKPFEAPGKSVEALEGEGVARAGGPFVQGGSAETGQGATSHEQLYHESLLNVNRYLGVIHSNGERLRR